MEAKCADVEVDFSTGNEAKVDETKAPDDCGTATTGEAKVSDDTSAKASGSESGNGNGNGGSRLSQEEQEAWRKSGYVGRIQLTEDDKLLHRAVAFSYQVILHHLDEFVKRHLSAFDKTVNSSGQAARIGEEVEHRLEWTAIHAEYVRLMESKLEAFCVQEKLSVGDLYAGLKRASESSRRSQKMVGMLLAASEYSRFIRLMRRRVKKHQDEHDPESDHDGANSSSSSSDDGQGGGTRSSSSNSTSRRRSSREAKV